MFSSSYSLRQSETPKSWVRPGKAAPSKPKANIHGSKLMLSIWWDHEGVLFYQVLEPLETITADHYQQQMIKFDRAVKDKRLQYDGKHDHFAS